MMDIYQQSVTQNVEYAGIVYKNWLFGTYSYTVARKGTTDSSSPGLHLFKNWEGIYHSHGAYDPRYQGEIFSPQDKDAARSTGVPIYVVTPSGIMKKYDPKTQKDDVLYRNVRLKAQGKGCPPKKTGR